MCRIRTEDENVTKTFREIRILQQVTNLLMFQLFFQKMIKKILQINEKEIFTKFTYSKKCFKCFAKTCEKFFMKTFKNMFNTILYRTKMSF